MGGSGGRKGERERTGSGGRGEVGGTDLETTSGDAVVKAIAGNDGEGLSHTSDDNIVTLAIEVEALPDEVGAISLG